MILEMLSNLPEKELKERHPEKNPHFVKAVVAMTDIAHEMIKESPEFREAFARVHAEFLKYPESRSTIEEAFNAQRTFAPDVDNSPALT